ncbi:MAG: hypothetical protein AVDCRST_MAG02-4211, partial [uncultured Rubrobacteraceae bacterium]
EAVGRHPHPERESLHRAPPGASTRRPGRPRDPRLRRGFDGRHHGPRRGACAGRPERAGARPPTQGGCGGRDGGRAAVSARRRAAAAGRGGPDLARPAGGLGRGKLPAALPGGRAPRPLAGAPRAALPPASALLRGLRDLRAEGRLRGVRGVPPRADHGGCGLCPPAGGRGTDGLPARAHGQRLPALEGGADQNPPALGPHANRLRARRNPLAPGPLLQDEDGL